MTVRRAWCASYLMCLMTSVVNVSGLTKCAVGHVLRLDVCRRCNLACDRFLTLVVKFFQVLFWRPEKYVPSCPLSCATAALGNGNLFAAISLNLLVPLAALRYSIGYCHLSERRRSQARSRPPSMPASVAYMRNDYYPTH